MAKRAPISQTRSKMFASASTLFAFTAKTQPSDVSRLATLKTAEFLGGQRHGGGRKVVAAGKAIDQDAAAVEAELNHRAAVIRARQAVVKKSAAQK